MKHLRNLVSRRANKVMLDQETGNTSNQADISEVSLSKQQGKIKNQMKGLKRSIKIEREGVNEDVTHELEEVRRQSDSLKLVFNYFESRFQEIQNQIRKSKEKVPAEKKRKLQVETFKQKGHRLQHEFNAVIMEDLQNIIDNTLDKQDPVSTSLKDIISQLRKKNKLIKIADSTEGSWAVVAEYEKELIRNRKYWKQIGSREYGKSIEKENHGKFKIRRFQTLIYPLEFTSRATVSECQFQA